VSVVFYFTNKEFTEQTLAEDSFLVA